MSPVSKRVSLLSYLLKLKERKIRMLETEKKELQEKIIKMRATIQRKDATIQHLGHILRANEDEDHDY